MHLTRPYLGRKITYKDDVCMKVYGETKSLYLESDASGIGLGASVLQTRDGVICPMYIAPDNTILRPIAFAFARKCLNSAEQRYSNIKRGELGILHGVERFCHYCFARKVSIITNHKPLVAQFRKDVAMLLQRI